MREFGAPSSRRSPLLAGLALSGRAIRLSSRQVDALVTSLALPVMLMLMFVYLFGGALSRHGSYVSYVVPGVMLLCAGFTSAGTAVAVSQDMAGGMSDRLASMDVGALPMLGAQVMASIARNLVSGLLVVGVALLIGFHPAAGVTGWLGVLGVLLAFVCAVSWMAAAIGLLVSSPEAANGFSFVVMFLPYASSAFVPVDTMPSWLQGFATHQPVTPVIETLRALLLGGPVGAHAASALIWCAGLLAISLLAARALFARRIA
jgi:ABC-2 type transport system permease protein